MSQRDHFHPNLLTALLSASTVGLLVELCAAPPPLGLLECTSQVGSRLSGPVPTPGKFFQLDLSTFPPRLIATTLCRPPRADAATSACLSGAGMPCPAPAAPHCVVKYESLQDSTGQGTPPPVLPVRSCTFIAVIYESTWYSKSSWVELALSSDTNPDVMEKVLSKAACEAKWWVFKAFCRT